MRRIAVGLILAASLSGCSHAHSVAWFRKHHNALKATLKKCSAMPAKEAKNSGNCQSAILANSDNFWTPTNLATKSSKGVGY
jgi:branched-subunit amino acid aminotransferase/4-amino-4-deoxychorismate lyase